MNCQQCNGPLDAETISRAREMAELFGDDVFANTAVCESCGKKWDEEVIQRKANQRAAQRQALVASIIPKNYLATNVSKFPVSPHKEKMNWDFPNGIGLWIEGKSGTMKSRLAYEIIRRNLINGAISSVEVLCGMNFSDLIASKWSSEPQEKAGAAARVQRAATNDLLYIDDLDKFRPTPSALNALLFILEERQKNILPILITTQANASTFLKKLADSANDGGTEPSAIVRRIVETTIRILTSQNP